MKNRKNGLVLELHEQWARGRKQLGAPEKRALMVAAIKARRAKDRAEERLANHRKEWKKISRTLKDKRDQAHGISRKEFLRQFDSKRTGYLTKRIEILDEIERARDAEHEFLKKLILGVGIVEVRHKEKGTLEVYQIHETPSGHLSLYRPRKGWKERVLEAAS